MSEKNLIVIVGPTGVGKTNLSIEIAKSLGSEIISCDSRQMYRELKIGTAVPTQEQIVQIKHHFIGNLSIHDYYNAAQFETEALSLLERLFKHSTYALMVGGSGLYVDAVTKGIDDLPTISSEVRQKLLDEYKEKGLAYLLEKLKKVDKDYYQIADLNNSKRVLKGLEVYEMTGKKYSQLRTQTVKKRNFLIKKIGLTMDREKLYERINRRVDEMVKNGLVEEAKQFLPYKDKNSLNTVGYKELFGYFCGEYDLNEAIRLIKRNSRHYAKRQLSWFHRDKEIKWFSPFQKEEILKYITSYFSNTSKDLP